jgi:hypothetical protein
LAHEGEKWHNIHVSYVAVLCCCRTSDKVFNLEITDSSSAGATAHDAPWSLPRLLFVVPGPVTVVSNL